MHARGQALAERLVRRYSENAGEQGGESGFVMVFVALMLTVMLVFAAFTIDFGSWYTRSAELKRAADAAALAGVVWMPELDQAQQYALATAAKNGFVNGVNNIQVTVSDIPNNNRQLKVTITDYERTKIDAIVPPGRMVSPFYDADFGPSVHRW